MGSRRAGCPLPTPLDSRALRLGTLTNLFVGDLSFFFFCCVRNDTHENTYSLHESQQGNRNSRRCKFGVGIFFFFEPLCQIMMLKLTSVTQSVVWGSLKVFIYMESSKRDMLPRQKACGKGQLGVGHL